MGVWLGGVEDFLDSLLASFEDVPWVKFFGMSGLLLAVPGPSCMIKIYFLIFVHAYQYKIICLFLEMLKMMKSSIKLFFVKNNGRVVNRHQISFSLGKQPIQKNIYLENKSWSFLRSHHQWNQIHLSYDPQHLGQLSHWLLQPQDYLLKYENFGFLRKKFKHFLFNKLFDPICILFNTNLFNCLCFSYK